MQGFFTSKKLLLFFTLIIICVGIINYTEGKSAFTNNNPPQFQKISNPLPVSSCTTPSEIPTPPAGNSRGGWGGIWPDFYDRLLVYDSVGSVLLHDLGQDRKFNTMDDVPMIHIASGIYLQRNNYLPEVFKDRIVYVEDYVGQSLYFIHSVTSGADGSFGTSDDNYTVIHTTRTKIEDLDFKDDTLAWIEGTNVYWCTFAFNNTPGACDTSPSSFGGPLFMTKISVSNPGIPLFAMEAQIWNSQDTDIYFKFGPSPVMPILNDSNISEHTPYLVGGLLAHLMYTQTNLIGIRDGKIYWTSFPRTTRNQFTFNDNIIYAMPSASKNILQLGDPKFIVWESRTFGAGWGNQIFLTQMGGTNIINVTPNGGLNTMPVVYGNNVVFVNYQDVNSGRLFYSTCI